MEPPLDKQTSPKQASPRGGIWLLLILLVSVLVYAPSLENDFAMDDVLIGRSHYATGEPNPMVSELRPLGGDACLGAPSVCDAVRGTRTHTHTHTHTHTQT